MLSQARYRIPAALALVTWLHSCSARDLNGSQHRALAQSVCFHRKSMALRLRCTYLLWGARSVQCETKYILQSSGGAIRRALFRVERGVCVRCKADCRALVLRLRAVEKGSRDWEARRHALIAEYAPRCRPADLSPSMRLHDAEGFTCTAALPAKSGHWIVTPKMPLPPM